MITRIAIRSCGGGIGNTRPSNIYTRLYHICHHRSVLHERWRGNLSLSGRCPRWISTNPAPTYPQITAQENAISCKAFLERYQTLQTGSHSDDEIVLRGRNWGFRQHGKKLAFIALLQDKCEIQCVFNLGELESYGVTMEEFTASLKQLHHGDVLGIKGQPRRDNKERLRLHAIELPQVLSPCLQPIPTEIKNEEIKMRHRHLNMLVYPHVTDMFHLRSEILRYMRNHFYVAGFAEVQTPILAGAAGGATAHPFYTVAHARGISHRRLALRIAPELWLKRLVVGGMDKIYEIGPSFRNEGIDLTHNPEFWTCEFYQAFASLDDLIRRTEQLFDDLQLEVNVKKKYRFSDAKRIQFIPALEQAMGFTLPDLTDPNARAILEQSMTNRKIEIPEHPSLPRLLDHLCGVYLEPVCEDPTWIMYPPECLSPLSKTFADEPSGQRLAARAELFVNNKELVNTYEEENSPDEQRRKFKAQLEHESKTIGPENYDESYLKALEYALPPTGGWGCGIDRLVMLFGDTNRIADTLTFGSLHNVASLNEKIES